MLCKEVEKALEKLRSKRLDALLEKEEQTQAALFEVAEIIDAQNEAIMELATIITEMMEG